MKYKTVFGLALILSLGLVTNPASEQGRFRVITALVPNLLAVPFSPIDTSPFQTGERLIYRISWSNFVEAGTAELTVGPGE